jgi:energy-coupling factor transporter ATP-binding protein EcfA2
MASPAISAPPAVRIHSFAIQNFRTFRERTVIPLEAGVTVFHGDTGSGKSTALAALDAFLRAVAFLLTHPTEGHVLPWTMNLAGLERPEPLLTERDRPLAAEPTILAATLVDAPSVWLEVRFAPSGDGFHVKMSWSDAAERASQIAASQGDHAAAAAAVTGAQERADRLVRGLPASVAKSPAWRAAQDNVDALSGHAQALAAKLAAERAADETTEGQRTQNIQQLLFPFGSTSRALAILDARRRPRWRPTPARASGSNLAPELASELYRLRTSKVALDRERWRSFVEMLTSFPTLRGATVSVEAGEPPEIIIEHPGRVVLGLDELSSGEQELVALTATLLLSKAGIGAVEEPEMGLDTGAQGLWRDLCDKQRAAGFMHQVIFESHAVTFDGAHVVRFRRDSDGWTRVESALAAADHEITQAAKDKGAAQRFVTPQGYTQLPEAMLKELAEGANGGHVWFLRGKDTWEAWPEAKLEGLLAEKPG